MAARPLFFVNGTVILPDHTIEDGAVVCRAGRIVAVGTRDGVGRPKGAQVVDAHGGYIGPGYVDIHVHGAGGADYMDGTLEAVRVANRVHARHGTTTIFPTTTTGSREQITAMLKACKAVQKAWKPDDGSQIAGVHFYGPYFAPEKVGCHLKSGRRDPDPAEYKKDFDLGIVRVATCAAELPGAEAFYREAARRGYLVTCGHSDASWSEMTRAYRAGMRHVDHFWCAMSSVPSLRARLREPMQGSMEQFTIFNTGMSTEVIADGEHLAPELLEYALRMLGPERLLLVTDANRAVDMPKGRYRFGPKAEGSWFISNGKVGINAEGTGLASTVMGMDHMVRTMKILTSASISETVRMGSLTPAERTGIAREVGSLEPGKRADVLVLGRDLKVKQVFLRGAAFNG